MSKYELSLSRDYVPDWTFVDGVREIFQNALDQQSTVAGNDMFFSYDAEKRELSIGNKLSVLDPKSLLLGASTKRDDDKTIGKFGEGYKIATLVLTRLDKNVVFYNYGKREVWRPRFVNSRRYGAEILTFFVDKKFPWVGVPDNNLTIVIGDVTEEEYQSVVQSNLHLSKPKKFSTTEYGRILQDPELAGKVFVNGLYVASYDKYVYGYDFIPSVIDLDRDRKLVSDFNLQWLASKMWSSKGLSKDDALLASSLVRNHAADVAYLAETYTTREGLLAIADVTWNDFISTHGKGAIPVKDQATYDLYKKNGYRPVFVQESAYKVLIRSRDYSEPVIAHGPTFLEKVSMWLDVWREHVDEDAVTLLEELIEEERTNEGG